MRADLPSGAKLAAAGAKKLSSWPIPERRNEANRKDVSELPRTTAEPPRHTFDEAPFALDDGTRRVKFRFSGWAHTRGDGFVCLPNEQVLTIRDAHGSNWPQGVDVVAKWPVRHVPARNRRPGGMAIANGQKQFPREIYAGVRGFSQNGQLAESALGAANSAPTAPPATTAQNCAPPVIHSALAQSKTHPP